MISANLKQRIKERFKDAPQHDLDLIFRDVTDNQVIDAILDYRPRYVEDIMYILASKEENLEKRAHLLGFRSLKEQNELRERIEELQRKVKEQINELSKRI